MNTNIDNSKLISLLEAYGENPSAETYGVAIQEIITGDSQFILPSINEGQKEGEWKTLEKGSQLKLTSVFDQDGLKVLAVFSTLPKMMAWSQNQRGYTAMQTKDVVSFCEAQGIDRIVVDTGTETMFVLERKTGKTQNKNNQEETKVKIGPATYPITGELLESFKTNFAKVSVIQEAYQYNMLRNEETVMVLGFVLDTYNENSSKACIHAIQDALQGQKLELPLEMFMLNNQEWHQTVKGIEGALVYKK